MNTTPAILKNECTLDSQTLKRHFERDVLKGLSKDEKSLPCKYIYDEKGSELFCRIMDLPEYYLTDCEMEVLSTHKERIFELFSSDDFNLTELGAGDGIKTRVLIEHFFREGMDFQYCPIDISESAVEGLADDLNRDFKDLEINGLVTDYFKGLAWLSGRDDARNLILFLGSNIGNFSRNEAIHFLKGLRSAINLGDHLLIGFDLIKDIDVMRRAYNDGQGVTEEFNTNILARINRELGGEFDLDRFRYRVVWNDDVNAIKSFQVSTCDQDVHIKGLNRSFEFSKGEPIHTESSHKFTVDQISKIAVETGFEIVEHFLDNRKYFVDSLWKAV